MQDENEFFESVTGLCEKEGMAWAPVPEDLGTVKEELAELKPEAGFIFDFYSVLDGGIAGLAEEGFYCLHLSLLPAQQGPWPVNRSLIEDERETGVTLFRAEGDPMKAAKLAQKKVWVLKNDDAVSLYDRLAEKGAGLLTSLLPLIKEGKAESVPLDLSEGSRHGGLEEDSRINWLSRSFEVYNKVRALTRPFCGAFTTLSGETMVVWKAVPDDTAPGLLNAGELDTEEGRLYVGTREGVVRLVEVEWKGEVLEGPRIAEAIGPYWREKFE
jgi:methionyl-tRNA formyltransferase